MNFFQLVSETEQKEDKRITRSRFIEEAILIDSGHYGSGYVHPHHIPSDSVLIFLLFSSFSFLFLFFLFSFHRSCLTIRKGVEGNYSHNNPPGRQLPQVLLLAARRLYLAQCLHAAQEMQTLTRNSQPTTPASMSVLGGICDIFLHIDMRADIISTLEYPSNT